MKSNRLHVVIPRNEYVLTMWVGFFAGGIFGACITKAIMLLHP